MEGVSLPRDGVVEEWEDRWDGRAVLSWSRGGLGPGSGGSGRGIQTSLALGPQNLLETKDETMEHC